MYTALRLGQTEIVRALLEQGVDVNGTDEFGLWYTHLHTACYFGHLPIVKLLIERGANVHALDRDSATPLTFACLGLGCNSAKMEIMKLLLCQGADPDAILGDQYWIKLGATYVPYLTTVSQFPSLYTLFGPDIARDLIWVTEEL